MQYKSVFVSDIHLGTGFSKAEQFLEFLKSVECENFYFVGDIIDGWAIKRKFKWKQSHSDVIQKVLRMARKGTHVYFVAGNHDEFLRPFLPLQLGNNLHVANEFAYNAGNGKRYLVTHGDFFDSVTMTKKWLAVLGDIGYDMLLHINAVVAWIRRRMGIKKYWSLSQYVKDNVKSSVSFINDFEGVLAQHVRHHDYDGVICGHIHKASLRRIGTIEYMNCGDWVESCSAVVEHLDGTFEIVYWRETPR